MKKIKIISMILAFVILVTSCNLGMMFTSNAATSITVSNASDLAGLAKKVNDATGDVSITISKNIDASGIEYTPINATGKKITFDGQYRLISNLNINGGGLFSSVGDGSIFKFVTMYNCTITDFDGGAGYGFLAGSMNSGTVNKCFVDGTISVYGDSASHIGGLVGSFGGKMEKSVAMVDIYTNGSYVGGLIGSYSESETMSDNHVSYCYSTGNIDNDSRDYIGGLVGYSATPAFNNSYTSMCILNPYADTVKAIGVILGLQENHNVYYDKNVSLQRQGDMDPHRSTPSELSTKLTGTEWTNIDGYYPQLDDFANNSSGREFLKRLSAISAAVVDVSRDDGITTGREFTVVSSADRYSFATLTTNVGNGAHRINWRITGGVDEYYFDPNDLSNFPTNSGATLDGLSGNTYDVKTGKYLFTNTGDIRFTAYSGDYERDIYVHVTTADKNPYIQGGTGTATDPFIINNCTEFDMIRVYCLDDEIGYSNEGENGYYYSLEFSLDYINDDTAEEVKLFDFQNIDHCPIIGMKGTLIGNDTIIRNLNIGYSNDGNSGLFATITKSARIMDIHISDAVISSLKTDNNGNIVSALNAGILAGTVENAHIQNVIVTGIVENSVNSGIVSGKAYGNTKVDSCLTYGLVSGSETAGGIFGYTDDNVEAIHTYSGAVVTDAKTVGGFFATGGGDVTDSLFTGNLSCSKGGVRNGLLDTGTVTDAYFDWQAAGILYSTFDYAVTTESLLISGTEGINLNSDYWGWYASGEEEYDLYPQLLWCMEDVLGGEYDFGTYTSRTSNIAALPFLYSNSTGQASSISFEEALAPVYYLYNGYDEVEFFPYSTDTDGYSVMIDDDYIYYEVSVVEGGKQVYNFTTLYTDSPCDTRYIMFNVKNINVHYKFDYDNENDQDAYNADMIDKGLTTITNGFSNKYNLFLDSNLTDHFETITFVYAGDALGFKMTQGEKYTYTINIYSDQACTNPLTIDSSSDGEYISIADLDDVYVVFTIEPKKLPWGIYRLTSN